MLVYAAGLLCCWPKHTPVYANIVDHFVWKRTDQLCNVLVIIVSIKRSAVMEKHQNVKTKTKSCKTKTCFSNCDTADVHTQ